MKPEHDPWLPILGCLTYAFILLLILAFWAAVIYVGVHFINKWW